MLRHILLLSALLASLVPLCLAEPEDLGIPIAPLPQFTCQPYDYREVQENPTNVNELLPHNIKVIMSMGDSITAAFAATSEELLHAPIIPREDRYLSYTSGGGSMRYTLNNFFAVYQNKIQGGSPGQTLPIDALSVDGHHLEPILKSQIGLNAALSGAKIQDIPDEINYLVTELTTTYNQTVDFENDWKFATLLIGANNLCVACYNDSSNTPETYGQLLNSSISQLYQSIPRVRLSILPIFNITQVWAWSRTSEYCERIWWLLDECPCLSAHDATEQDRKAVNDNAVQYRQVTDEVVSYWQEKNLTTFAVEIQPITESFHIINANLTSNFDCFHPSALAHSYLGAMLWNSIMSPPGQKPTNATDFFVNGVDFICPERDSYIY